MRQFILGTILILSSCTTKKDGIEENKSDTDTVTQPNLVITNSNNEIVQIDFPLDSLLNFDSEEELKKVFGDEIQRSTGYYPEGMGEVTLR